MSYAGDVKQQIINSRLTSDEAVSGEKLAYAILHGNTVMSENKSYIERISNVYRYNDPESFVRFFVRKMNGGTYVYGISFSEGHHKEAVFTPEFSIGFIRACFVKNGFVSAPDKSAHFEIVFDDEDAMEVCMQSFAEIGHEAKTSARAGKYLIYMKDAAAISDLLARLGAVKAMLEYENGRIMRSANNMANRGLNCDMANLNKTINCAQKQIQMLKAFSRMPQFALLPKELKDMAKIRLENPEVSLSDLGQLFNPPLSKSGVSHRLSKLKQAYETALKK